MTKVKISFSLKVSLLYIFFGALWILFSDKVVSWFVEDLPTIEKFQLFKGWFFVLVTGILLYIFIRRELQKRNLLYNQLKEANEKANESDRLKSAFLGNLSHYIRTPMNSILGFTELMEQRDIDEEKRKRFYSLINQQSQFLLQFINNIVDISKIQSGQLEVSKKYFRLNSSLNQLSNLISSYKNDKGVSCKINFYPGLPDGEDNFFSDEDKIKHILTNLLTNAINYGGDRDVHFGYVKKPDKIVFYVKDLGDGLPEHVEKYLFKQFLLSTTPKIKGNEGFGLGLYLSSSLVKLLEGEIWLENTGPKGTKFCFSIPFVE